MANYSKTCYTTATDNLSSTETQYEPGKYMTMAHE
jgi:hypothetical protein